MQDTIQISFQQTKSSNSRFQGLETTIQVNHLQPLLIDQTTYMFLFFQAAKAFGRLQQLPEPDLRPGGRARPGAAKVAPAAREVLVAGTLRLQKVEEGVFPACQVRLVGCYVSCRPPSRPPPRPPPPDLNRKCRMAVFPAGPQPRAPDGSFPRRTSTASSGWQCSPPDLNRELRLVVFPAGPQPRVRRYAR